MLNLALAVVGLTAPPRGGWTRADALHAAAAAASFQLLPAAADEPPPLADIRSSSWALSIPQSFYRPKSRPKAGTYDDTVFIAADYTTGHTASVTSVSCRTLLLESGDPIPLQAGEITSLKDLGKAERLAKLLIGRRDNDPLGLQPPRTQLKAATRDADSGGLSFECLTLTSQATSMVSATPGVRRTVARSFFLRDAITGEAQLITAWASSAAPGATCETVPCGTAQGASLGFQCPPPKCEVDGAPSALDLAIVNSLRV